MTEQEHDEILTKFGKVKFRSGLIFGSIGGATLITILIKIFHIPIGY